MRTTFLTKAAASVLALSCGLTVLGTSAHAMTLMDFIRGGKGRSQQQVDSNQILPPSMPIAPVPKEGLAGGPTQKVSAPTYYTYKTEPMRLVSSAKFADPVVTGAVADASAAPAAVDVDPSSAQRRYLTEAKVMATNDVAKALEAYYSDSKKPLLWIADNAVSDKAKATLAVLAQADLIGLDPADYRVAMPVIDSGSVNPADRDHALTQFELALSAKVLAFVQDDQRGRIDPNKLSGYHDFKRKDVDLTPVLGVIALSPDVTAYLNSRNPENPQFDALKAEYAKLKSESAGAASSVAITLSGVIKPGDSSPQIANIIKGIQARGSDALTTSHADVLASYQQTPEYTPDLVSVVEAFQKEKGLTADGVIGQSTVRAIVGENSNAKLQKLTIAMEQLRWLPDQLGPRYVFINQAAFMVYYYNNNKEELEMRAVVGAKGHQTNFFENQVQTVEFNPVWGVPQSIIINEMLPKLRRDPSYLDKTGYQVEVNGQPVSSASVDWSGSTKNIAVRQPPSSDNALGALKILFPNSHAIYMHDTPQKSFFKKDMRALSHGCVRLADPRAMAAAVLNTTVDEVNKQIATGENKDVPVPQKFPVYIAYFTAWPDKNGVVQYFDDVYDRDLYTQKAFDATTKVRDAQI